MYSEFDLIQLETLDDKIQQEKFILSHKDQVGRNSRNTLINKYVLITQKEFLEQRIAKMIAKNLNNISLLCDDSLKLLDFDRNQLVTTPLSKLDNTYTETRNIIDIIQQNIPNGYRVYYHYNYADGNHGNGGIEISIENYEIDIHRNSVVFDPWCNILCCWSCSFRFTDIFDREIVI